MGTLLLDTNIVSYVIKNHPVVERYRAHLVGHTLAISFMTVGELFEGALRANWGEEKLQRLESSLRSYLVIPSTPGICRQWGQVRFLRRHSPISAQDAWIAATALEYDCPLVTHDYGDFRDITGLKIITA